MTLTNLYAFPNNIFIASKKFLGLYKLPNNKNNLKTNINNIKANKMPIYPHILYLVKNTSISFPLAKPAPITLAKIKQVNVKVFFIYK